MKTIVELVTELNQTHSKMVSLNLEKIATENKIKELNDVISILDNEIKIAKNKITSLTTEITSYGEKKVEIPDWYDTQATIIKKAMAILKNKGFYMTIREICDTIITYEPSLKSTEFSKQLYGNLASILGTKAKKQIDVKRLQNSSTGDYNYGLIEWDDIKF